MNRRALVIAGVSVTLLAIVVAALSGDKDEDENEPGAIAATFAGAPADGSLRWPQLRGADRYVLEVGGDSVAVGAPSCDDDTCELGIDPVVAEGESVRVVAYADGRVLARSTPLTPPPAPSRPVPPNFDVTAMVNGPDGPRIVVHPAASKQEADAIHQQLRSDPSVVDTEQDSFAFPLQAPTSKGLGTAWPAEALELGEAHTISKGAGVVVAVIDSGVWAHHPDLRGRVLRGINIPADEMGLPVRGTARATTHATAVAGVVAGRGGKGRPQGVAPEAKILPVDVQDHQGNIATSSIAAGILWATKEGARIINASIAGFPTARSVAFAINHASSKGVLVTAGTGNDGAKGCSPKQVGETNAALYPASFNDVVGVGGTEPNGRVWRCSHTGDYVDLVAPAKSLTLLNNSSKVPYRVGSGTSYSGPAVAGTAALLLSVDPTLSRERLIEILERTARPGSNAKAYGHGLVQPYRALLALGTATPPVSVAALPSAGGPLLDDSSAVMADAPPFSHLHCPPELAPTTYLTAQDKYTRYTTWIRPPPPIAQGRDSGLAVDSMFGLEVVSVAQADDDYSGPAQRFRYGLGRSTNPTDYTVSYDGESGAPVVVGPVVALFERNGVRGTNVYDSDQPRCRPEGRRFHFRSEAVVFPGQYEFFHFYASALRSEDMQVAPGRYALLVILDGHQGYQKAWDPPWWTNGRFPVVTVVGPR